MVETHATPLGPGVDGRPRTAVIEAVIAQSDRAGFRHVDRRAGHSAVDAVGPLVDCGRTTWCMRSADGVRCGPRETADLTG